MFDLSLDKNLPKPTLYEDIFLLLQGMLSGERDVLANLANTSSLFFSCLPEVNWVGFYRVNGEELVLGPFQGKPACIRIPHGQGVCGLAFAKKEIQLVADVEAFPGHIACDVSSKSEIVLPLVIKGRVVAVLDIDSPVSHRFDEEDKAGLTMIVDYLCQVLNQESAFWCLS